MTKLRIADGLSLPIDLTTQATGIVAKRRAGKSYTARRIVEQALHAGQQVVIVDPKGDWWGIRSSADGKSPGFPVVILGGERGDVPLEANSGEIVAKLVVEERVSVLLDLSLFRKHEVTTFMTAFLENLYRLKAREAFRTPVLLVVDEADAIMPQKPQKGEERMLGAGEDIVRRGGQRGIGCLLITQRTAVLNKNVLTQVQLLVALRTIAPQDLKAMNAWIDVHGTEAEREQLMTSLPSLPVGDAYFWSPGWPTTEGIFKRVHVLPIETFDSGATPKAGEKRVEPKNLADVDLEALTRQMAATIEKAKATDPKLLQKEVARLKAELATKHAPTSRTVEKPVVDQRAIETAVNRATGQVLRDANATIADLQRLLDAAMKFIIKVSTSNFDVANVDKAELEKVVTAAVDRATKLIDERLTSHSRDVRKLRTEAASLLAKIQALGGKPRAIHVDVAVTKNEPFTVVEKKEQKERPVRQPVEHVAVDGVTHGQQKLLDAAARLLAVGIEQPTRGQVAALAPMSPRSSATERYFAANIRVGLFAAVKGGVSLTDVGRAAAAPVEVAPTLREYHDQWRELLSGGEVKLFNAMVDLGPGHEALTRDELARLAGISNTSSATERSIAWLISLDLFRVAGRGEVAAGPTMYPEGLE